MTSDDKRIRSSASRGRRGHNEKAIANMWYHLMYTRPDQMDLAINNSDLWENVFAEMMRYDPVVHAQAQIYDPRD